MEKNLLSMMIFANIQSTNQPDEANKDWKGWRQHVTDGQIKEFKNTYGNNHWNTFKRNGRFPITKVSEMVYAGSDCDIKKGNGTTRMVNGEHIPRPIDINLKLVEVRDYKYKDMGSAHHMAQRMSDVNRAFHLQRLNR
jgi:hypothetical protein